MDNKEAVAKLKEYCTLNSNQLDFLDEMCYIHKGMWDGDTDELIVREAKRDIALTLRSFYELKDEELIALLEQNGDIEWLKKTIQKLKL